MSQSLSEHCRDIRRRALFRAGDELRQLGFTSSDGTTWVGRLDADGKAPISVLVELPPEFPDVLPKVFIDEPLGAMQRAHVGRDRKVCIAPDTGLLLDTEHPEKLLIESIELAREVLFPADYATENRDLEAEFQAYWAEDDATGVLSICDPTGPSGRVVLAELDRAGKAEIFIGPDLATTRRWFAATNMTLAQPRSAYFTRLTSLLPLPGFEARTSLEELLRLVETHASSNTREGLENWLKENGLPSLVLLSAPLTDGTADVVFGVHVPQLSGPLAKKSRRGFRRGRVPGSREVMFARPLPVRRLTVTRGDQAYVLARGGGDPSLLTKHVIVIGCGAVGSHAAASLAASGVGNIILIDHEEFEPANIHRHVLGAADCGRNKAEALTARLRERFPLTSIEAVTQKIENALEENPEGITTADMVLVALGDETLELRLNDFLGGEVVRIHVWLEPMGLGGHVLATGIRGQPGCLACLYHRNISGLLVNQAGLAEPNQQFQQNLGGCQGTFTPYGALDAQRAAIESVRESIRLLTEPEPSPALTSWVDSPAVFVAGGLKLSARGRSIAPGTMLIRSNFARPDCAVCKSEG